MVEKDEAYLEKRKTTWEREFLKKGEFSSFKSCRKKEEDIEKTFNLVKNSP